MYETHDIYLDHICGLEAYMCTNILFYFIRYSPINNKYDVFNWSYTHVYM